MALYTRVCENKQEDAGRCKVGKDVRQLVAQFQRGGPGPPGGLPCEQLPEQTAF